MAFAPIALGRPLCPRTHLRLPYLPLAVPAFATLGLLPFLGSWNNFLWPLVVSVNGSTHTLPVGLALLANGQHQSN